VWCERQTCVGSEAENGQKKESTGQKKGMDMDMGLGNSD
jgi:hypothetical protein